MALLTKFGVVVGALGLALLIAPASHAATATPMETGGYCTDPAPVFVDADSNSPVIGFCEKREPITATCVTAKGEEEVFVGVTTEYGTTGYVGAFALHLDNWRDLGVC